MRVFLTGSSLTVRAGHESATLALARALQDRGHVIMVGGSHPAQLPRTLEVDWIPLVADPARLIVPPDIIHACHLHDAFWALAALPGVPAILQTDDFPLPGEFHPRIYRHLRRAGDYQIAVFPGEEIRPLHDGGELGDFLEELYYRVIEEHRSRPLDSEAERLANLAYLRMLNSSTISVYELNPTHLLADRRRAPQIEANFPNSKTESKGNS